MRELEIQMQIEFDKLRLEQEINDRKIAFGNKEHTTDQKMRVSVLLRLFISSNKVCNSFRL